MDFLIGHAENAHTGVTVIISEKGAVGGVDVRGSAPGTRETDLLRGYNSVERINAVTLSGGSAFGLESACGVMEYLYGKGIGFDTKSHPVPIVCSAVLFDLLNEELIYPDKDMGIQACENAKRDNYLCGNIGAGKGATVGKIRGMQYCSRGGLGVAVRTIMGATIAAVFAVNAVGDVYDYRTNRIIAGARLNDGTYLNSFDSVINADFNRIYGTNTTIGAILTDAVITREQANKLASVAHDGLALSVRPVHTAMDGDTIFAMSECIRPLDFNMLCALAVELTAEAVVKSVSHQ